MPTDVIIEPSSGQIYWNDSGGIGASQSISIAGNAQDQIRILGYGFIYTLGGSIGASTERVIFNDSLLSTIRPGANGSGLGDATYSWDLFAYNSYFRQPALFQSTNNSTSLFTGSIQSNGGIGVSGNASIGQTLNIFNSTDGRYFVGFRAASGLAATNLYTLPTGYPGTGTSVLQSDTSGNLSWTSVLTAGGSVGSATTSNNTNVNSASTGTLYPVLTPASTTVAGAALSSDTNLSFDSANNVLFVGGLTAAGSGVTTSLQSFEIGPASSTGQTVIFGSGTGAYRFNIATSAASGSTVSLFGSVTANYLLMNTGSGGVLRIQTDVVNSRVRMFENMTTTGTLGFFGTSGGTLYLGTDSGTSNGDITIRGNNTTGGGGNQRAAIFTIATATSNGTGVGGTIQFQTSTSSTSGNLSNALRTRMRIEGAATGTSNLESLIIFGDDTSGTAYTSTLRGSNALGTDVNAGELIIQAAQSTGTGTMAGICFNVASPGNTGAALNPVVDVGHFYSVQNSTASNNGTFVVKGGLGVTGNAFFGGTVNATTFAGSLSGTATTSQNTTVVFSSTPATNHPLAFTPQTSSVAGAAISAVSTIFATPSTGTLNATTFSGAFSGTLSGYASTGRNVDVQLATTNATHAVTFTPQLTAVVGSATSSDNMLVYNPSTKILTTSGLAVTALTETTSSTTGAFLVTGSAGIARSLSVGTSVIFWNGANYSAFKSGATSNQIYTLPTGYPGTGTSVLASDTSGTLTWVPSSGGGGGSGTVNAGAANKVAYYPSAASTVDDATGMTYAEFSSGTAVTFQIFGGAATGNTIFTVSGIGQTLVRVGIGVSNPQFELEINGEISATNKSFVIDHPTKPGMKLRYGSLEGPENGVYVRGELKDTNIIIVPDHWYGLVDVETYTVHLTPIGTYAQLFVEKIEDYNVKIGDSRGLPIHCYYSVWAERKDIPKLVTEY